MTRVKVNFDDVQDFAPLPEGVYEAVIEKIEFRPAKEQGKSPYLNVEYTVVEPDEFAGRKLWEILSWSPKALFRMRDFFRAAGFEEDEYDLDIDEGSDLLLEPDLSGEAVTLTVENEIYNKKEVNRVVATEFANPPGTDAEADDDEEDDEELEELDDEEEEVAAPKKVAPKAAPKKAAPPQRTFR